ncbi:unnamed protein product [Toxocara canis]|uniref:SH3 domain-containing protein n=1 Tax=Toxocara canis TaxID=6265 RepID=A0A183V9D3_TOXCA|nr:unnamed protein product [Toxocara canis]
MLIMLFNRPSHNTHYRLSERVGRIYEPAPDYDDVYVTDEPPYPPPESPEHDYPSGGLLTKSDGSGGRISGDRIQNSAGIPRGLLRSPHNTRTQKTLRRYGADQGSVGTHPTSYADVSGCAPPLLPRSTAQKPPAIPPRNSAQRAFHESKHEPPHRTPPQTVASRDALPQQSLYNRAPKSPHLSPEQTLSQTNSLDSPGNENIPVFERAQRTLSSSSSSSQTVSVHGTAQGQSSNAHRSPHPTPPPTIAARTAAEQLPYGHERKSPHATPPQTLSSSDAIERNVYGVQKSPPTSLRVPLDTESVSQKPSHMSSSATVGESLRSTPPQTLAHHSEYEYRSDRMPKPQQRAPRKDIGDYLRAIGGVPVLPPLTQNSEWSAGKIGAGDNLAFRRHVANHRAFDTLNSFKSCETCPICKAMNEGQISLAEAAEVTKHSHEPAGESLITSGKAFEKLEEDALAELYQLDDYVSKAAEEEIYKAEETTEASSAEVEEISLEPILRAQALQDFEGANDAELSVKQGEIIEVPSSFIQQVSGEE